ncbi:MAG: MBL fold metallo-hydrolase [Clostridia bacterium]|nr:MBL fold metallo-hydrolase [Clostridia bacterium]
MELHFLKIIWGDAIVLKNGDEVALVDTGYDHSFELIKEYLDTLGVKKISLILLTHFHRDHYGSIPALLNEYEVGAVCFKEYSGYEARTATGTPADDEYRQSERDKCENMKRLITEKSTLIKAEETESLNFAGYEIKLFNHINTVKAIYDDENHPLTYQKICHGENLNSLAAFIKVNGVNVFLGGDIGDSPSNHPLSTKVNTRIAQKIGEQIDVYKVPHHGTSGSNSPEALAIYKPKIAVITNRIGYLSEKSTVFADLKAANPDVRILLTEISPVVIEITEDGEIEVKRCDDLVI